ncbi:MAG: hypothetical protein JSS49_06300 [Planctomycetes bacterium]|nr:hypothetical protein [Planctomycetota bacterium]
MPLHAVPTLMLAVGATALILGRWVPSARWYEVAWLMSVAGAAVLLATGDSANLAGAVPAVWSVDPLALAGIWIALLLGSLFGIGSFGIRSPADRTAERLGFLSFLIAGIMLVASANDLVTLGLSIEIVQFAAWALRKTDHLECSANRWQRDQERGRARDGICLWLGITASCCLWLGIALLVNLTASTHFDQIRLVLTDAYVPDGGRTVIGSGSKLGLLAIGFMVAGLGGRVGLAPWQVSFVEQSRDVGYWTAGCVLLGTQLAGILALARLCGTVWLGYRDELIVLLLVQTLVTYTVSAALAGLGLLKHEGRLRRWAVSISLLHAAWLTIGLMAAVADLATPDQSLLAAGSQPGALALLLFAIGGSQLGLAGLFLVLSYLSRDNRDVEYLEELQGLGRLSPLSAGALLFALASLIGHPPLWGFWSNWLMLVAGLNIRSSGGHEQAAPHIGLILGLIVATIATLMTASVVIRISRTVLLEQPISRALPKGRRAALVASCSCALILLLVGLYPARLLNLLSQVRSPDTKSRPNDAGGVSRGASTAQN